jgi:hypothetical protein
MAYLEYYFDGGFEEEVPPLLYIYKQNLNNQQNQQNQEIQEIQENQQNLEYNSDDEYEEDLYINEKNEDEDEDYRPDDEDIEELELDVIRYISSKRNIIGNISRSISIKKIMNKKKRIIAKRKIEDDIPEEKIKLFNLSLKEFRKYIRSLSKNEQIELKKEKRRYKNRIYKQNSRTRIIFEKNMENNIENNLENNI